jgi:hypothetical protein
MLFRENARDGTQWLPNVFPLWELHLCKSVEYVQSLSWKGKQTLNWVPRIPLKSSWSVDA